MALLTTLLIIGGALLLTGGTVYATQPKYTPEVTYTDNTVITKPTSSSYTSKTTKTTSSHVRKRCVPSTTHTTKIHSDYTYGDIFD